MNREKLMAAIQATSINSRLSCEKAHEMAGALNVTLKEIGDICNELKIKIIACRLGCF